MSYCSVMGEIKLVRLTFLNRRIYIIRLVVTGCRQFILQQILAEILFDCRPIQKYNNNLSVINHFVCYFSASKVDICVYGIVISVKIVGRTSKSHCLKCLRVRGKESCFCFFPEFVSTLHNYSQVCELLIEINRPIITMMV